MQEGAVWIQMRAQFKEKKTLFGVYNHSEVLAHEYVHAVRYPLKSEKYEEFFAYFVSKKFGKNMRAIVGPLFATPLEAKCFLLAWMLPLFASGLTLLDSIHETLFALCISFPTSYRDWETDRKSVV